MTTHIRALIAGLALALASLGAGAASEDMTLLLELHSKVDDTATSTVSLWGTGIDPNTRAASDRFRLLVDGTEVDVPPELLAALSAQRRSYSYDTQSGGIATETQQALCMMAGPALGDVLYTRYLTYENSRIVASEMRPVFSEATNCLFPGSISPKATEARIAAAKAMAKLQVLRDMAQR